MGDQREAMRNAVRRAATDGRLSCAAAHDLGKKLGVSLREIGEICNELHIKIKDCQLGCF